MRNCCLDEANVCMGCGRTLEEIVRWSLAPDAEKAEILERSRARRVDRAGEAHETYETRAARSSR